MYSEVSAAYPGSVMIGFSSANIWASMVVVGAELGDQEGKFLGYVDTNQMLLYDVCLPVGVGEDDIEDRANPAQPGRPDVNGSE